MIGYEEVLRDHEFLESSNSKYFYLRNSPSFDYSDGDEIENRIHGHIENASDLSSMSDELASHCIDWPSSYHLSSLRSNLLRPFESYLKGKSVLEFGSGCGAVTRYLAENSAYVVANEGSAKRSEITSSRIRDIPSAIVVNCNIDVLPVAPLFDLVVIVGVLEYAEMLFDATEPHLEMVRRARSFLKPGGKLLLAIENKHGLKYFAGSPEDHTGKVMQGINDEYISGGPRTFTARQLHLLFSEAGFISRFIHTPLPDYKLVRSVITSQGLATTEFNSGELFAQTASSDPQLPAVTNFHLQKVWRELHSGPALANFANSFLIEASDSESASILEGTLAVHFGEARKSSFRRQKHFGLHNGQILVSESKIGPETPDFDKTVIRQSEPSEPVPYYTASTFDSVIQSTLWSKVSNQEDFENAVKSFLVLVTKWVYKKDEIVVDPGNFNQLLPGRYFDLTPKNVVILDDGSVEVFDQEWELKSDFELGFLLFRVLLGAFSDLGRSGQANPWLTDRGETSILGLIRDIMVRLGADPSKIASYLDLEHSVYSLITPNFERENATAQLMSPRDLNLHLSQTETMRLQVEAMRNSYSWKITEPLRVVFSKFRKP